MIVYRELKTLGKDLGFPVKTLYALSNNLDKHYRGVSIPKRDGTMRKLSVPDFILKSVQRSIVINILAYYPVSRFACAYRYGASVQKNARPHIGKKKLLKLDEQCISCRNHPRLSSLFYPKHGGDRQLCV